MGRGVQIAAAVLGGVLLFGAGVLVATTLNDDDAAEQAASADPAAVQSDALLLQQVLVQATRFDELIAQARAENLTEKKAQTLAIGMQRLGAQVEQLAAGLQQEKYREPAADLGAAYIEVGVGLITNDAEKVQAGAEAVNTATDELAAQLNPSPEPSSPAPSTSPAPSD